MEKLNLHTTAALTKYAIDHGDFLRRSTFRNQTQHLT
jgi:hypothetical protein